MASFHHRLTVDDATVSVETALGFMGWKSKPRQSHINPDITLAEIEELLKDTLHLNVAQRDVAQLRRLSQKIVVQTFNQYTMPALKPNLLMITAKLLFDNANKIKNEVEKKELTIPMLVDKSLSVIDFIAPRRPLKAIMTNNPLDEPWQAIIVSKPIDNGPIYIDRTDSYQEKAGSIGNLFTKAMIVDDKRYERYYVLSRVSIGPHQMALSGEIDCVDDSGYPVELKTRPKWKPMDPVRQLENWVQSSLVGIDQIITAGYGTTRGVRNGPVTFHKSDIAYETLEMYGESLPLSAKNHAIDYGATVLSDIKVKQSIIPIPLLFCSL